MIRKLGLVSTALVLGFGVATQASADVFTVDPSVLGGPASTFTANAISGDAETLVTLNTTTDTGTGTGWISFTSFPGVLPGVSGLGVNYQLWAEFDYGLTVQNAGDNIGPGVDLALTSLSIDLYGAEGLDVTFEPDFGDIGDFSTPTVNLNGATRLDLGSANLVAGVIEPTSQAGNAFNATGNFALTAFGQSFFLSPDPFYNVVFSQFNNTTDQISEVVDGEVRISSTGRATFTRVPEPATVLLLGVGLMGAGFAARRRV